MTEDALLARAVAEAAGARLMEVRSGTLAGRELKDAGDRAAQEVIAAALAQARPDDAVLSEEARDDGRRVGSRRVWIVDPLDGTREFSEPARQDWAVHVALWQDGDLVAGAVALPAMGVTLGTDHPPEGPSEPGVPPRVVVSRTRPPAVAVSLAESLGATLVAMGSAGAKICAVVRGEADVYVHAGGQFEWDSAAPVAVARAAGLHTSRVDGSPLRYNREDPYLPDLLVCRPELADRCLALLAEPAGAQSVRS